MAQPVKNTENSLVIFLHIPKAAGTTLREIFRRQYRASEFVYYYRSPDDDDMQQLQAIDQLSADEKRRFKALSGHMPFGISEKFPQNCVYFTMLREPVSRVISQYYFIRNNPKNRSYSEVSALSLEEFVTQTGRGSNFQTRLIAGEKGEDLINGDDLLERARHNLDTHFITPGTTERFDESLLILQRLLKWRFPYYVRRMTNKNRPARSEISAETRALIEAHNQLDLALYAYADQLLQAAIDACGDGFPAELARFRRFNTLYGMPMQIARSIKYRMT